MRRVVLLAPALVLWVAPPAAGQARTPLVQSIDLHVPVPPTPVTIAGRRHLAYELHLTNFRPFDVALGRVEVRDADRRRSLADLRDAALGDRIGRPGSLPASADKRVIAGGMRAVVYLWLPLDDSVQVPTRLSHRIELDLVREQGRTPVEGAPWVFRGFEVVGGFETIQAFAAGGSWKSVTASEGGARRLELPAPNVVVLFR